MKLPASDKTSNYGVKPHIRRGYYPAVLLSVQPYLDADKKRKIGKFGTQQIFEFMIYKPDENGGPTDPIQYLPNPEKPGEKADVIIAKFVYDQYRNKTTGEFQTAITPNSAITKLLKALGWAFSPEGVETDNFIGSWVEVDIDDYEYEDDDGKKTASTIKEVVSYKGPSFDKLVVPQKKENTSVQKEVKHSALSEESPEVKEKRDRILQLQKLHEDGLLTKEGLAQAKEQIEAQIDELIR